MLLALHLSAKETNWQGGKQGKSGRIICFQPNLIRIYSRISASSTLPIVFIFYCLWLQLHHLINRFTPLQLTVKFAMIGLSLLFFSSSFFCLSIPAAVPRIPIQSFSSSLEDGLKSAMEFTMDRLNSATPRTFLLQHRHNSLRVSPSEGKGWALMAKVCSALENPGFSLMLVGEWRLRRHEPFWLVSSGTEVPMVNWELSPRALEGGINDFEVSIRPPNAEFLADLVLLKRWHSLTYLHDWDNGDKAAQTARQMSQHLLRSGHRMPIHFEFVQLPKNAEEFGLFLGHFFSERYKLNVELGGHRILLDATNAHRQQKLLQAVANAVIEKNLMSRAEFILANFDLLPEQVVLLEQANVTIIGGQLLDRDNHEYGQLLRHLGGAKAHLQASQLAFVHDALLVAKHTFARALMSQNESLLAKSLAQSVHFHNVELPSILCHARNGSSKPFELGKSIAKAMNELQLESQHGTLTGHIEFGANGVRRNFDVKVVELGVEEGSRQRSRRTIRHWRHSTGFLKELKPSLRSIKQPRGGYGLSSTEEPPKRSLRVVTVLSDPFVMLKPECRQPNSGKNGSEQSCQPGNGQFEGFCIDLLKLLREHLQDFHYEIFTSEGNRFGKRQADGSYDGIIGHLLRAEADLSIGSLTINQERERVIDFSQPFMTTGISIMIKKPEREEFSLLRFMAPLSSEVWLCIMFAFVGVSIVIYFTARFSPFEFRSGGEEQVQQEGQLEDRRNSIYRRRSSTGSRDGWTVFNSLWFTWAALLGGGGDMSPRSLSVRIASSTWFFFTLIMISSYTANLAAFLTIERMHTPIESLEDLAKQTKIKYGIQQGGSTEQFFRTSSVPIYQQIWKFMEEQIPSVFVPTYAEGIERVREEKGRYAFLLESTANEYANMRQPCDTMKIGENLNSVGYGVATPFGSELKDRINLAILALQETGQLRRLRNKWWYDRGQCSEEGGIDSATESLTLRNVAGVFYVLIAGMALALVVSFVERIYRKRQSSIVLGGHKSAKNEGRNDILLNSKRAKNHH